MNGIRSLALLCIFSPLFARAEEPGFGWFKGNTHTHSYWSDGNDFPEMIADWYKKEGYHFLVLSDHNILSRGEKWITHARLHKKLSQRPVVMRKYIARFGEDWVEIDGEGEGPAQKIRLKTLEEIRPKFDEAGRFLLIEGEEIIDRFEKRQVHINAINLGEAIAPQHGDSVRDTMRNNLIAVEEQAKRLGKPIFAHLNHPNFQWSITAEDIAHVLEEKFFEVYNGHPGINHLGDPEKGIPGDEKIWDIANTLRLSKLHGPLLYGVATDDSHTYHGGNVEPGRGWVMVRARSLDADAIVAAMQSGQFYASSGVSLKEINFHQETKTLRFSILPQEDASFMTRIIGTLKGEEDAPGIILAEFEGTEIEYKAKGKEWYIRATITSSQDHPRPSFEGQKEQAWTQPVRIWSP